MALYLDPTDKDLSINKLIILHMLSICSIPISNSRISEFMISHRDLNYFSLQEYLTQMEEGDLILPDTTERSTFYKITENGSKTLDFFINRIHTYIRNDIKKYLNEHQYELKKNSEIIAEYIPKSDDEYLVHCKATENGALVFEFSLTVYDKDSAIDMCKAFKERNHEVYKSLLLSLG